MPRLPAALAILAALLPATAAAEDRPCRDQPVPPLVEGRAFAVDGDTLAIAGAPRIRLWGIQAPELRAARTGGETLPGMAARAALADLLDLGAAGAVRCRPSKWDRWCRLVASCDVADDEGRATDLGAALLQAGMAYGFMLDDTRGRRADDAGMAAAYADLESRARKARAGLWRDWLPH